MNTEERKIFTEFAEDAFAEIDENLGKIRKEILKLETFIGKEKISKNILNNLLIPFHTIKGISGMVGLSEIQNLSHSVEHFIKFLIEQGAVLTRKAIDGVFDAVKLIEAILVTYRENKIDQLPKFKVELDRLIDLMAELCVKKEEIRRESKVSTKEKKIILENFDDETRNLISEAFERGKKYIYRIKFFPSQELYEKGININVTREELQKYGEILKSKPNKEKTGKIYFEIIYASNKELENLEVVQKLNLEFEKILTHETEIKEEPKTSEIPTSVSEYRQFSISNVVRIELSKIDELINMLGDLVMVRAKFDLLLQNSKTKIDPQIFRSLSEINSNFERKIRNLREGIMRTRLVSIGDIFDRMKFVVYDLVRSSQKSIDLEISGSETEIDKFVVEKMFDPLLHIVRNSVSHGIETSEERIKLGKNPVGKLKISAFASGDSVVIEISDDGKGIDKAKVAQKALETGIIKVVSDLPNTDILNIICSPGFSTKDEADMGSGRGVGMTSVKRVVDELGGRIELWTELNKGTKFTIYLPLTLAIADAMIVEVGDQLFAVPQPNIFEIYNVKKEDIRYTEGFEFVEWRNQVLPLIFLNKFFNLKSSNNFLHSYHIIIVETTVGIAGIVVDRVKTKREIVVRALSDPLVRTEGISGATELGDGRAVLILDTTGIVNSHQRKKKQKEVSL